MYKLLIPIGISGSGKSRLYKTEYSDYTLISPDEIRREINGNVSDQSNSDKVFAKVDANMEEAMKKGDDIFYDATNLNTKFRKEFVKKVKYNHPEYEITYYILPCNPELSKKRIKNDLENGVDRSVVPDHVIYKQVHMYDGLKRLNLLWEGVDHVIEVSTRYEKV